MIRKNVSDAVRAIEALITDPAIGLPEDVFLFVSSITPLINVDLLIVDKDKGVLLTWRGTGNYSAGWHVPGGIIRVRESLEERLVKCAKRELGVDVEFDPEPIAINQMIHPNAKTRVHFVSVLYRVQLSGELDDTKRYKGGEAYPGEWKWHLSCPAELYKSQEVYRSFIDNCE